VKLGVHSADMRSSRLKVRSVSVNLADDSSLRWVSLIPEAVIHAHGSRWNFAAAETDPNDLSFRFDDAVESLERWLLEFAPPIAIEHDKNGMAAGYLRRIRVLSAAEAAALGIVQRVSRMIYGGLDFTSPMWAERFDAGEIPYVSPNIRAYAATELDEFPAYPFAIGEVSLVTIPQIKSNQVPVADMRGVSLSEGDLMMSMEECAAYCAENGMDQAAVMELIGKLFAGAHAEAHKANPELAEDPEAIEAAAIEELERAAELEKVEEDKKAETLLAENGRLKADLRAARKAAALAHVRAALGGRKVSAATEATLADAWLSGSGKFDALLKDFSGRVATAARTVAPVAGSAKSVSLSDVMGPANFAKWDNLSDDDQWGFIKALSEREKIAPHLAASWIRFGRVPDSVVEQRASKGGF
jgi:hypothetical protein